MVESRTPALTLKRSAASKVAATGRTPLLMLAMLVAVAVERSGTIVPIAFKPSSGEETGSDAAVPLRRIGMLVTVRDAESMRAARIITDASGEMNPAMAATIAGARIAETL